MINKTHIYSTCVRTASKMRLQQESEAPEIKAINAALSAYYIRSGAATGAMQQRQGGAGNNNNNSVADCSLTSIAPSAIILNEAEAEEKELIKAEVAAEWDRVIDLLKKIADTRTHVQLLLNEKKRVVRLGNFERARYIENVELVTKRKLIDALQVRCLI